MNLLAEAVKRKREVEDENMELRRDIIKKRKIMKDVLVQFTKNIKEERKRGDVAEKDISDTAKQMPPLELKGLIFTYFGIRDGHKVMSTGLKTSTYDQLDFFDRIDDVIISSFNCVEMRRVLVEQKKLKKKNWSPSNQNGDQNFIN